MKDDEGMETARLVLRRFTPADASALAAYRSDPEVSRYQSWESPVPMEEAERWAGTFSAGNPRDPGWFQYAVERRDVPGLIGDVGVCLGEDGRQAQLGFTFAPAFQGHGYASSTSRCSTVRATASVGLHRVWATCDGRNVRSANLLGRVGFRREGHLVQSTWFKGEWTDDVLFGLLASEHRAASDSGHGS